MSLWGLALWTVSTIVGGFVVYLPPQQALALVDAEGVTLLTIWLVAGVVAGALAGALVGLGQRLALRGAVPWAAQWVARTVLGWVAGGSILTVATGFSYSAMVDDPASVLPAVAGLAWPVAGAAIGVAQWVLLRRYVHHAAWWIAIMALAWELGAVALFLAIATGPEVMDTGGILGGAAVLALTAAGVGGAPGLVTGLALNWLVAHNAHS
jgi:hypothetical protein